MSSKMFLLAAALLFSAYCGAALADPPCVEPPPPRPPERPVKLVPMRGLAPGTPAAGSTPRVELPSGFTKEEIQNLERSGLIKVLPDGGIEALQYMPPRESAPPCAPPDPSVQSGRAAIARASHSRSMMRTHHAGEPSLRQ
jgi:hypothetical protein